MRGLSLCRRIDFLVGVPVLYLWGALRRKRRVPTGIRTIIALQTAAIGDTVLMAGPMRALKEVFPDARVIVVCGSTNACAARMLAGADDVLEVDVFRPWKAIAVLRRLEADVLVDFGAWPRINAIIAAGARARYTVGFATKGQYRHFAYDRAVMHRCDRHELENQRALVAAIGVSVKREPALVVAGDDFRGVGDLGKLFVVFHPWASGSGKRLKEWPTSHWVALAGWVAKQGMSVVVTGGKEDAEAAECLAEAIRIERTDADVTNLAGKLSLMQTCGVLKKAQVIVSVNTGIMHIAAILGCRVIGLHGPTNPARWGPVGSETVAITPAGGEWGYLNLGFEYPNRAQDCMSRISPDSVIGQLKGWIECGQRPFKVQRVG